MSGPHLLEHLGIIAILGWAGRLARLRHSEIASG
jgi:hypothetical protein